MRTLQRLMDYLEANQVRYAHSTHPAAYTARALARAEEVPDHSVAKTVVFSTDQGYIMAVLPADHNVDEAELRGRLGVSGLRLATEQELANLFPGSEAGAMPPFGNLYGMPVYVDSTLAMEDAIAFNAGTHKDVIYIYFTDFARLAKPFIFSFSRGRRRAA